MTMRCQSVVEGSFRFKQVRAAPTRTSRSAVPRAPEGLRPPYRRSRRSAARERRAKEIDCGVHGSLLRSPVSQRPVPATRQHAPRLRSFRLAPSAGSPLADLESRHRAGSSSDREQQCDAGGNPCTPRELCRRGGFHASVLRLALRPLSLRCFLQAPALRFALNAFSLAFEALALGRLSGFDQGPLRLPLLLLPLLLRQ